MNWNHIIIEGYCAREWDWREKHSKYYYTLDFNKENPFETRKKDRVLNPKYDPTVKKPKLPKYCKKEICLECIPCKYLAYTDVEEEIKKRFNGLYRKYCDERDAEEDDGL